MDSEYEKRLAAEVDRELKGLPELQAPAGLVARVMAVIAQPVRLPWYHRAWQTWPLPLQIVALIVLGAFLGALCFGGVQFTQSTVFTSGMHHALAWVSPLSAIWNALNALGGALVMSVKQLGTWFLVACAAAVALAWAMCLGVGTIYLRLAFARR